MIHGLPWSEDDDQRLRDLAQSGLDFSEIALQMSRSNSVIRRHAERLNISVASGRHVMTTVRRLVELGLKAKK